MKLLVWIPIVSEIGKALLALLMVIDSWVYNLISSSYKIFMALSGARLLSSDAFSTIANKLYIVVGVVMLFVLSYAIIKAIIDPDQMTKGELGGPKLIKGVLIAVIGLGIAPVLFNMLYQAQGIILENNVLGKIFFRSEDNKVELKDTSYTDDEGNTINIKYEENEIVPDDILSKSGGALVATHVWQAFFYPASGNMEDAKDIKTSAEDYFNNNGTTGAICGAAGGVAAATAVAVAAGAIGAIFTLGGSLLIAAAAVGAGMACYNASDAIDEAYAEITNGKMSLEQAYVISASEGDFGIYTNFLDEVSGDESSISYIFIISTIVGGVVLYAFISFSIDMGVRCAKLAYYQIIAPIPLILQILPKFKDSFSKYVKGVFSTFLEVFIRISVVYVVVYIICHLTDLFSTAGVWKNLGAAEALFARVLLVVGLVIFAKQAPKMIQETFGIQSGSMSLGIGKKLADGGALVAGAAIGGGITAGVRNFTHAWQNRGDGGVVKGIGKGLTSGFAGAISGAARSGYGAKDAKKFSDMARAAGAGAQAATDKRDEREAYAATHDNVLWGHVKDTGGKIKRWAGINSLETLKKKNENIQKVEDAVKAVTDAAEKDIMSAKNKNKSQTFGVTVDYGRESRVESMIKDSSGANKMIKDLMTYNTSNGLFKYDALNYRRLEQALTEARNSGKAVKLSDFGLGAFVDSHGNELELSAHILEDIQGDYLDLFKKAVANQALVGDEALKTLSKATGGEDTIKAMSNVLSAQSTLRSVLGNNFDSELISQANDAAQKALNAGVAGATGAVSASDIATGELKIDRSSMIDKIGVKAANLRRQNDDEIRKIREREGTDKDKK